MKATLPGPPVHEFHFPDVDTLSQVREEAGAVEIRADRGTFSNQRKSRFIRALASKGFRPDRFMARLIAAAFLLWAVLLLRLSRR